MFDLKRLKAAPLGDLITEEDLHDIVKSAIPKAFFERRMEIDRSGYNPREVEKEPLIYEIMHLSVLSHLPKAQRATD